MEMDKELCRERGQRIARENTFAYYRNGFSQKTVKTQLGEIAIRVLRYRKGNYEPKIIAKYDRNAEGLEDENVTLYACGMSQRDIAEQINSPYNVAISLELVSKILRKSCRRSTLAEPSARKYLYPFIFMDAIHCKVKENH